MMEEILATHRLKRLESDGEGFTQVWIGRASHLMRCIVAHGDESWNGQDGLRKKSDIGSIAVTVDEEPKRGQMGTSRGRRMLIT